MLYIKKYFKSNKLLQTKNKNLRKKLKEEKEKNDRLREEMKAIIDKSTPQIVIEKLLGEELEYFDYMTLDDQARKVYYNNANLVLNNDTFKNEVMRLLSGLIQDVAKNAESWERVISLRHCIVGIEAIKKRLESITPPQEETINPKKLTELI